ncbi:hypothetical protein [Kitasatospora sp. NPDC050463]|uniref:hypothetical protein n=1 Tax=Kitasatospora sp. NPDC050463 TaxID=3155786 RepID=UPI0033E5D8B1
MEKNVPVETKSGPGSAFYPPAEVEITSEEDGMVTVPLAGTSLAAVLRWCREAQDTTSLTPWIELDSSIGRRVGAAIAEAMERLVPSVGSDEPTAVVYLDDRIAEKSAKR